MPFEIRKAVRRALPLQVAFVGPQNSGKTLSALLFAAGLLTRPGQRVIVICTEKGRATLYADNWRVRAVMPDGYDWIELDAPYTPKRFIEAIDTAERAAYTVCLIDSSSDCWDGPGGCTDMAEEDKNMWNRAKRENKRLMTRIALSSMHILCCLKAQDKVKIIGKDDSETGKQQYVSLGMQPICEKNFFFPMTFAFQIDPVTHLATTIKTHDDVAGELAKPRLITKQDGEILRRWVESAKPLLGGEQLIKRSRDAASRGTQQYREFYSKANAAQKSVLEPVHAENEQAAEQADKVRDLPKYEDFPPMEGIADGARIYVKGKLYKFVEERSAFELCAEAA